MARGYAADDYAAIRSRMSAIGEAEKPRCPQYPSKLLHACLRESVRCPIACPHHGDWIGPSFDKPEAGAYC